MFRYLPEQASEIAPNIDWVNNLITDISVFFTAAIVGTMLYFAIRYRRTEENQDTPRIYGNHFLEVLWTVIPTVISAFVAYQGLYYYRELRKVPADAMTINVLAKKWDWTFEYENGKRSLGEFKVPVGKPVKLLMRSNDVLHSLFIPAMRVKNDAIPGRYSYVSFTPVQSGEYYTFCTEYCGTNHWNMRAQLSVVSQSEFDAWLADKSDELRAGTPLEEGEKLYVQNCQQCHSIGEQRLTGPGFQGLYMKERNFTDGTSAVADENYLRTSILYPGKQVVEGFTNSMTAWEGLLTDEQIDNLITFIKSLDAETVKAMQEQALATSAEEAADVDVAAMTPVEHGEYLMKNNPIAACTTCHSLDGSEMIGPTYKGLYGKEGTLVSGESYTADDEYIKESIVDPSAKVVDGFAPAMPPYQFSDEELDAIVEYLKTLK